MQPRRPVGNSKKRRAHWADRLARAGVLAALWKLGGYTPVAVYLAVHDLVWRAAREDDKVLRALRNDGLIVAIAPLNVLQSETGLSEREVMRALRTLAALGWLTNERGGYYTVGQAGSSTLYVETWLNELEAEQAKVTGNSIKPEAFAERTGVALRVIRDRLAAPASTPVGTSAHAGDDRRGCRNPSGHHQGQAPHADADFGAGSAGKVQPPASTSPKFSPHYVRADRGDEEAGEEARGRGTGSTAAPSSPSAEPSAPSPLTASPASGEAGVGPLGGSSPSTDPEVHQEKDQTRRDPLQGEPHGGAAVSVRDAENRLVAAVKAAWNRPSEPPPFTSRNRGQLRDLLAQSTDTRIIDGAAYMVENWARVAWKNDRHLPPSYDFFFQRPGDFMVPAEELRNKSAQEERDAARAKALWEEGAPERALREEQERKAREEAEMRRRADAEALAKSPVGRIAAAWEATARAKCPLLPVKLYPTDNEYIAKLAAENAERMPVLLRAITMMMAASPYQGAPRVGAFWEARAKWLAEAEAESSAKPDAAESGSGRAG